MRTDDEREDQTQDAVIDTDEELDVTEDQQDDQQDKEADEPEEETVIGFGDEIEVEDDGAAPDWVKELRKKNREQAAEIARLKTLASDTPEQKITLGPKPKIADFDYDEDAFDAARDKWEADKRALEEAETAAERKKREQQESWSRQLADFAERKQKLARADFDDAQARVEEELGVVRTRAVLQVASAGGFDPAMVMYALGKSPSKLQHIAAIPEDNGIALVVALTKLSGDVKMKTRKKSVAVEEVVRGSAPLSSTDKHLEKLEREADRTGDRTKVIAYRREVRTKEAARGR